MPVISFTGGGSECITEIDMAHPVTGRNGDPGMVAYAIQGAATRENPDSGPDGMGVRSDDCAYTLEARQEVQAVAFAQNQCDEVRTMDVAGALASEPGMKQQTYVAAFEPGSIARNAGPAGESHLSPTLRKEMGDNQPAVRQGMQVRRLTPVECARLQGFPDTYLDIPYRNKPAADGPKYKALGNSMAVPVMRWIGERIQLVQDALEEL